MQYRRYAVYYMPREGALAEWAAGWLGWDAQAGCAVARHGPAALLDEAALVAEPARYGFHGTIRAPFRPAEGLDEAGLKAAVAALAARLAPASSAGLRLADLHGFLALVPEDQGAIAALAATVVEATDTLRAPLTEAEIARRNPDRLSPRQRGLLDRWGYPHVMEEFRFHLTLTGRLGTRAAEVAALLEPEVAPHLPRPFAVEDLCLAGEDEAGRFHLVHRYALTG